MITIFKNMDLIDGICDKVIPNALVVVEDDKIAYAGSYEQPVYDRYVAAEGVEIIDAPGKTVMPGLIDVHVHLSLYGKPSALMDVIMDSATLTAIKATTNAKKMLDAGFTTIRCCGEKGEVDFAVRSAVEEGYIVGPRILASGKAISMTGGHGDFLRSIKTDSMGDICDGEVEVRRAARDRLKKMADSIKLMATGGGMSPGPGTVAQLTVEEMRAAVEEAEKRNVPTAAHAIGRDGINNALKAGVCTIEHGSFLDDEGIDMMVKYGRYLVPTLVAFRTMTIGATRGVPMEHVNKVRLFATEHFKNLDKAVKAGVKVICGTDTGTPFNFAGEEAEELELYTQHGLSPMAAIKSATSLAAEAMRRNDFGSLVEGKSADLLLVKGNPVENIALLQNKDNIEVIMRCGVKYKG